MLCFPICFPICFTSISNLECRTDISAWSPKDIFA
jgi:hypothetical protein